jgi:hypothetical protein
LVNIDWVILRSRTVPLMPMPLTFRTREHSQTLEYALLFVNQTIDCIRKKIYSLNLYRAFLPTYFNILVLISINSHFSSMITIHKISLKADTTFSYWYFIIVIIYNIFHVGCLSTRRTLELFMFLPFLKNYYTMIDRSFDDRWLR